MWGETSDGALADGVFLLLALAPLLVLACGAITAAKGRWGWLAVGLLTSGLIWPLTALMAAAPGSAWERLRRS
jgi:hypothetical protein